MHETAEELSSVAGESCAPKTQKYSSAKAKPEPRTVTFVPPTTGPDAGCTAVTIASASKRKATWSAL